MPRFGTKSLLIGFAVVALWLSTFSGFAAAQDVRRSILLLILIATAFAAVYSQGKRRAFWAGFATVMLLCGGLNFQQPLNRYLPNFGWQWSLGNSFSPVTTPYFQPYASYAPAPTPTPASPQPPAIAYPTPPAAVSIAPVMQTRSAAGDAVADSATAAWVLVLSAVSGYVAAYLYEQNRIAANGVK